MALHAPILLDRFVTSPVVGTICIQITNTLGLELNSPILQNARQTHFSYIGPGLDPNNPNPDSSPAICWNNRTRAIGPFYTSSINTTQNNQNTATPLTVKVASISIND